MSEEKQSERIWKQKKATGISWKINFYIVTDECEKSKKWEKKLCMIRREKHFEQWIFS